MLTEGMEITRGTKKIIQEAIDTVDVQHQNDRIRLCEAFCHIVESRYTGGAMSYQLKRMGNSYPFELLTKNNWTVQDALDNELIVSLDEGWFAPNTRFMNHNGLILRARDVLVKAGDDLAKTLTDGLTAIKGAPFIQLEDLAHVGLELVASTHAQTDGQIATIPVWEPVSDELQLVLEEKMFWLSGLIVNEDSDGTLHFMSETDALNFTPLQARAKGMVIGKGNTVKIPLNSTGPILESIDKYLYDKTGQYTI